MLLVDVAPEIEVVIDVVPLEIEVVVDVCKTTVTSGGLTSDMGGAMSSKGVSAKKLLLSVPLLDLGVTSPDEVSGRKQNGRRIP